MCLERQMANIHLLKDELINKIAAGEVVERPSSVAKELIENALDAGAKNIVLSLKEGGTKLISVRDDGQGIDPQDGPLVLSRHATSKISASDDLFAIDTMGFRGEALAAISSVSRFSLRSQREGCDGFMIEANDEEQCSSAQAMVHTLQNRTLDTDLIKGENTQHHEAKMGNR